MCDGCDDAGGGGGGSGGSWIGVKYLVPGCVGALSLVLARRWGVANGSQQPTGVSRRRRLAAQRDPPLKRPQPNRAKAEVAPVEGRRSCERAVLPRAPRHASFPDVPGDGELLFESTTFFFTALAAGAQFLNLYRTVWWLPHSYTDQTMNFYLIDRHVVIFILAVLVRRLFLSIMTVATRFASIPKLSSALARILSLFTFGTFIAACFRCLYNLYSGHPALSIFFLCYPVAVYLLLFGVKVDPLLRLEIPNVRIPHCCANGAPAIRNEVELLKADFNYRLKQIVFSSLIGAYYAGFIPWCFAQQFLHYDVYRIIRHLGLVWIGLFIQHAAHCLSARYCDHLHKAALHLGRWVRKNSSAGVSQNSSILSSGFSIGSPPINSWCHKTLWAPGSSVKHGKWMYLSVGCMTAAEPGNLTHLRFYALFQNPANLLCALLCMQISLVLLLIVLLLYTTEWHYIISLGLLLFSNYYTLFKLARDYLVAWKVYQMENRIQEKNCIPAT